MAGQVKGVRRYHSPLRADQAQQTRRKVLESARRLFVARGYAGTTVAASENAQSGSQAPLEQVCFANAGATATFHVSIKRFAGTGTPRMDLFSNNGVFAAQYPVPAGSLTDPGAAPGKLAIRCHTLRLEQKVGARPRSLEGG